MKKLFYRIQLLSLVLITVSCNNDQDLRGNPTVDWSSFGDEIVYNETDRVLSVVVHDKYRDKTETKELVLLPSQCDTLNISSFSHHICIRDCSEIYVISEGDTLARFIKGKNDFFNNYEYEEFDYHFVIEGKEFIAETPWPRYRYRIDEETLRNSNELMDKPLYKVELEIINATDHNVDIEFVEHEGWPFTDTSMTISPRKTSSMTDTLTVSQDITIKKAIITFDGEHSVTHTQDDSALTNNICDIEWYSEPFGETYNKKYTFTITENDYNAAIN